MEKIRLQGVGWVNAKPARELKDGDIILWNYGQENTVLKVLECSKCFVMVFMNCGQRQRLNKTRLVGVRNEK